MKQYCGMSASSWLFALFMGLFFCSLGGPLWGRDMIENRLINSGSPYLLQHAHNPVDWYPWGEEAFAKSRTENKVIFLSVGYSTCYWCHVAERTIYTNPKIAALMNKWFVNIKVDREERPDVDEIYMLARQVLSGGGGWPNNVFLTPKLKPFFAGSYFPPEDRPGVMGFPSLLKYIHGEWVKNPGELTAIADNVYGALKRVSETGKGSPGDFKIDLKKWLTDARREIMTRHDSFQGGFNGVGASKFPQSPLLKFLISDLALRGALPGALRGVKAEMAGVDVTLRAIAFGGMNDHMGGGVHRYATEPSWSIPHFEKMLFDNAQLIDVYTAYFEQTRAPFAARMVSSIVGYLLSQMTAPGGGFYTAEDADINGAEGESYLWSRAEITKILGVRDALRFFSLYELTAMPDAPGGPGVLRIRKDISADPSKRKSLIRRTEELDPLRHKLLSLRDRRQQPLRDEKIVVSLNGLAIAALTRAGKTFDRPEWVEAARRAGEFIWRHAYGKNTNKLRRYFYKDQAWGEGFLEDYASLALGYLALDGAMDARGNKGVWRARAVALASTIEERFMLPDGVVVIRAGKNDLIIPAIDFQDGDTVSGTSMTYGLLKRLGRDEPSFGRAADRLLGWMAPKIAASPDGWVGFLTTLTANDAARRDQASGSLADRAPAAGLITINTTDSARHVKARAVGSQGETGDTLVITLNIEEGYHINGNPASLDFLVPTRIILPGSLKANIAYPRPHEFKTRFVDDGIMVYEGTVVIKVELGRGRLEAIKKSALKVEVQACTDKVCLEPSVISVLVEFE